MLEILRLGGMRVVQDGADSSEGRIQTGSAETIQRYDLKLFKQFFFAVVLIKMPFRYGDDTGRESGQPCFVEAVRNQNFSGADSLDFLLQAALKLFFVNGGFKQPLVNRSITITTPVRESIVSGFSGS